MTRQPSREQVKMWRSPALPRLELLRATYVTQSFARHSHEGFAVGVIENGALGFFYRGENVVAPRGAVNLANPDEPHTGQAAVPDGWTYRMFYLDADLLHQASGQIAGRRVQMPFFRTGVILDEFLSAEIRHLHMELEQDSIPTVEKESRFLLMLSLLIRRHADAPPPMHPIGSEHPAVLRVKEFMEASWNEDISIRQLAAVAHLSPFHLIRVFARQTGMPPHAYLNQLRVRRARDLLAEGCGIAAAAAETGFVDQSHFTRHFKRILGITPGQFSNFVQYGRNH